MDPYDFILALSQSMLDEVRAGLDAGIDVNKAVMGRFPLVAACEGGSVEALKLLKDAGVDLEQTGPTSPTAITVAADRGHVEAVKLLASWGCDPNVAKRGHRNALCAAVKADNLEMVQTVGALNGFDIGAKGSADSLVQLACKHAGVEVLQALLDLGMSPSGEQSKSEGVSAAAALGKIEHITALASAGAPLTSTRRWDPSPLHAAGKAGQAAAVEVLVGCGADLNGDCPFGGVVCGAAKNGHDDVIRAAVDMGAEVNRSSLTGETAFLVAAQAGRASTLRLLAELGATTDAEVKEEDALCLAAKGGHKNAVEALLELGVTGKKDKAAALAKAGGHDDVAAVLE